jgi:hypothetical protein
MSEKPLTSLVKDITYFYIKHFYEKELQLKQLQRLDDNDLTQLIDKLYNEKANDLKKYIRNTLKENLGDQYSAIATENILIEMFNDPDYSKKRVFLEIQDYQNTL